MMRYTTGGRPGWLALAGLALPLAFGWTIHTEAQQQQQPQPQTPEERRQVGETGAVAAASVEDVVDNPASFYGQKVTVSGEVGEVFGQRVFNIQEEGIIDIDDQLLVLAPEGSPTVTEDSTVQVRGTVRRLVSSELESEFGPTYWDHWGVDRDFFATYDSRPVIFADAIDVRR